MTTNPPPSRVNNRLCILLVEDSDLLRGMLRLSFDKNHLVYEASTLHEGISLFHDKSPDIVFLDVHLPDGNGHDLARMIKETNPATCIVMATSSKAKDDKVLAAQNHVDGFIGKPFTKEEVNDHVVRFLERRAKP